MLHHHDNDHWREWREAVKRTGYTSQLARAAKVLLELETLTAREFGYYCARSDRDILCRCCASTNIADVINYGTGSLDFNGFWKFPCTHHKPVV